LLLIAVTIWFSFSSS